MENKLTDKQRRFCEEYCIDLNATQAAIRAGYSKDTAGVIGSENLSKDYLVDYIRVIKPNYKGKQCNIRARKKIGYLYVIKCIGTDFYKIGKSYNVKKRLQSLNVACPLDLELVFKVKVDEYSLAEIKIHKQFLDYRHKGEWFVFNAEELELVKNTMDKYKTV